MTALVQDTLGITPDGVYGPATAEALNRHLWLSALSTEDECPSVEIGILLYVETYVGFGGDPGTNNISDYLRDLRARTGFNPNADGSWCAIFASDGFLSLGVDIKSSGAKDIVRQAADKYETTQLRKAQPGDYGIASWDRGTQSWQGHVRFWVCIAPDLFLVIGGNEEPNDRVHCSDMTKLQFGKKLHQMVRMGKA